MTESWLDITVDGSRTRIPLAEGLTRVGGASCDVQVPDTAGDELHLWSDPPKVILVGRSTAPLLNGRAFDEATLADGDSIQWSAAVLVYGREKPTPVLEELPPDDPPAVAAPAPAARVAARPAAAPVAPVAPGAPVAPVAAGGRQRLLDRLHAGMLVDIGAADRKVTRRWQEAVIRKEFDADACARELLGASQVPVDDPRLLERAGRLERDLLMAPYQRGMRGMKRSARVATKRGVAYIVANLVAISIYTVVLVAIMLLVRFNYDFSFDGTIDRVLGFFRG